MEHGSPARPAVGPGDRFPPKGSSGSTVLGRVTSAGLSSLFHRCGPKIPLGLQAISQLLNGLGRAEDERGAGRHSLRTRAMPAGLCPPWRQERAVPVASHLLGAPASCARTFLRLSHGPGCRPAPATLGSPSVAPRVLPACLPAAAPSVGGLPAFPIAFPGHHPGLQESSPLTLSLQQGDTAVRGGVRFPRAAMPA